MRWEYKQVLARRNTFEHELDAVQLKPSVQAFFTK